MTDSSNQYQQRIARLKADLVEQGRRVQRMVEDAVESVFDRDQPKADRVCQMDQVIDRADVDIERAAVQITTEAIQGEEALDVDQIRWIFTIVKVNNELERIADEASNIAENVAALVNIETKLPPRFRVFANSVVGIVENTTTCFDRVDLKLAEVVLASDDLVDEFEEAIRSDRERELAEGRVDVSFALVLNAITAKLVRIDAHCTNIAEQVIYVASGKIVRHTGGRWTAPEPPA